MLASIPLTSAMRTMEKDRLMRCPLRSQKSPIEVIRKRNKTLVFKRSKCVRTMHISWPMVSLPLTLSVRALFDLWHCLQRGQYNTFNQDTLPCIFCADPYLDFTCVASQALIPTAVSDTTVVIQAYSPLRNATFVTGGKNSSTSQTSKVGPYGCSVETENWEATSTVIISSENGRNNLVINHEDFINQ